MTVLREVAGDLFAVDAPALAHGCNCRGSMGGGVAAQVRRRFPDLHRAYVARCAAGRFRPGECWPWQVTGGPLVYNLATQDRPGRHAELPLVRQAVTAMLADAADRGLEVVALPRLGAGIGGLRWRDVRSLLAELTAASPVDLLVVSRAAPPTEQEEDRDELAAMSREELLAFADANGYDVDRDATHAELVEDLLPYA